MTIVSALKRHPLYIYCVLAFGISWGAALIAVGPRDILNPEAPADMLPIVILGMSLGPALAAVLTAAWVEGRAGVRLLFSQLMKWPAGWRWYAALLIAPLSVSASLLLLSSTSSAYIPGILVSEDRSSTLMLAIIAGLVVGFLEELGWTGYATPKWRLQHDVFYTGLVLGLVWGLWHLLVNVWGSAPSSSGVPFVVYLVVVLFTFLPPYRILMVWIHDRTKSLPLVILMHTSLIVFWLSFTPLGIAGASLLTWYLVWAAVLWLVVAVVSAANHGSLTKASLPLSQA